MKLIDPEEYCDSFECWREATMVVEEMKDHRFWKEEAGLMEDQWPTRSDEDYNDFSARPLLGNLGEYVIMEAELRPDISGRAFMNVRFENGESAVFDIEQLKELHPQAVDADGAVKAKDGSRWGYSNGKWIKKTESGDLVGTMGSDFVIQNADGTDDYSVADLSGLSQITLAVTIN